MFKTERNGHRSRISFQVHFSPLQECTWRAGINQTLVSVIVSRKTLVFGLIFICALGAGVVWKTSFSTSPSNCSQFQRPSGQGIAFLCAEETLTDTTLDLYVRAKQGTPLIHIGKVSDSDEPSYFSGCYWSKDGSLFLTAIASNRPDAPLKSTVFRVGYDFLKHQPVLKSQFNSLLKSRGGAGPVLDLTR